MRYTDARYTHTSFDQDAQTRLRLFLSLVVSGNTVFKMSTKIRAFELQSKCVSLRPLREEGDLRKAVRTGDVGEIRLAVAAEMQERWAICQEVTVADGISTFLVFPTCCNKLTLQFAYISSQPIHKHNSNLPLPLLLYLHEQPP